MTAPAYKTVHFDDRLTIAETADWYLRLLELMLAGQPLRMDLQAIQRIDMAGLQLLVSFAKTAERLQLAVDWQDLSACVQQALSVSGLHLQSIDLNQAE